MKYAYVIANKAVSPVAPAEANPTVLATGSVADLPPSMAALNAALSGNQLAGLLAGGTGAAGVMALPCDYSPAIGDTLTLETGVYIKNA
jgi:hypothetical protein